MAVLPFEPITRSRVFVGTCVIPARVTLSRNLYEPSGSSSARAKRNTIRACSIDAAQSTLSEPGRNSTSDGVNIRSTSAPRPPAEREIMTGIGPVAVRAPRVRDRTGLGADRIRFSSALLPPYARRSKSLEVLIPVLYFKGISTGDFAEALAALLGPDAGGLSASTVARLTEVWADEHTHWLKRDLSARHYVYFWADGIHVQARLEDDAQCLLVIIGATPEGKKELVGLIDGVRESAQSWRELLLDLKRRGLAVAPELAIADGALGFWKAIEEVWPRTRSQRCWVHKTANVLNKLPKSQHSKAKRALQEIWMAETRNDADSAFDAFIETYAVKYDKAAACLVKDRETMLAFYDFPAEHWKHLRTTNTIESTFATVRHQQIASTVPNVLITHNYCLECARAIVRRDIGVLEALTHDLDADP